jgi:alpha-1,3-fucosyltransferase 10
MGQIPVDSYGRFRNNRAIEGPDLGSASKLATAGRYKFCLGFENTLSPDYVTEKLFDPILAGTVPVYRGAPNVAEFAPGPHSYIDANDFAGPRELAEYLRYLDGNDAAYEEYFAWRKEGLSESFRSLLALKPADPFCALGELVRERTAPDWRPTPWLQRFRVPRIPMYPRHWLAEAIQEAAIAGDRGADAGRRLDGTGG